MRKALSVKQFNEYFKSNIKHDPIFQNLYINGQLANIRINNSHLYFSLKEDTDIIDCVIYYYEDKAVDFDFEVGKDILVRGNVLYNNYSSRIVIVANEVVEKGISDNYLQFIKMKEEFRKKGYFDISNKKEISQYPNKIGLITSQEGAAIVDFLSVINQKPNDIHIYLYPVKVQGTDSSLMISKAVRSLDKKGLDLIVITRGGGSNEDLNSFNDRAVIEAVFDAKTPIISAIGHKIDQTLLDLVADLSLQTPTEAGSYLVKSYSNLERDMKNILDQIKGILNDRIKSYEFDLVKLKLELDKYNPSFTLKEKMRELLYLKKDLDLKIQANITYNEQKIKLLYKDLKRFEDIIEISKKNIHIKDIKQEIIFSAHQLKVKDKAYIEFSDGIVKVEVID
ncbi:exodeoxyribonuclease VII large subunit [Anaerococcus tetradius]|uniref:Exodeoxyribonuclease 7 large subunit n=2 Tax=Anaerococcus tetradius TaxID=33036 RepID=C2CFC6_9FIRM|nr:exodeoxyribonuclease VII large subunit [Anaerococcus tetradius]EEI83745.1 exodeoxyribonuclease VII, large subunit [Anaerococcus tetradius ATCC 35098]KWZ77709.1 exodeoxyribonuclease VII, large subunit [Anaerococcus tetradius]